MNKNNSNKPGCKLFGPRGNRPLWITAFLLSITTFIVYLPSLQNDFVNLDDNDYVYENENIRFINIDFLRWSLTAEVASLWHPLTMFSLALDYAIWGLNPLGYHLTNILFHSLNTFLVFILVLRLIKCGLTQNSKLVTRNFYLIAASVTALLFGIHPLHVESVAWVSERKDVLCAFFFLSIIIVYLKYTAAASSRRPIFYAVCLIFFILALMSKPMAVSLPLVLLILDFYPLRRLTAANGVLREKIPFFALSLLSSLITIWAHHVSGALPTLEEYPFLKRIFMAAHALVFYISKMIFPFNLFPFYPNPMKIDFFTFEYLGSIIILILMVIIILKSVRRNKLFSVVWLYYIITLIPVIGIVKIADSSMANRYTYLPSLGPFLLMGLGVSTLFEKCQKKHCQIILSLILLFLFYTLSNRAIKQIAVWRNSIDLWSYELNLSPDFEYAAYSYRGKAYNELGNYQQAIKDSNKSIMLNPNYPETYLTRGIAYGSLGNLQVAIKDFDTAIRIDRKYLKAYEERGNAYNKIGNYPQAINDYTKIIELYPLDADTYAKRGVLYRSLGDYRLAIKDFSEVISLNPQYAEAYNNRGNAYRDLGSYQQAIEDYNMAIKLNSKDAIAYRNRGVAYKNLGNNEQALKDFNKADELSLDIKLLYLY